MEKTTPNLVKLAMRNSTLFCLVAFLFVACIKEKNNPKPITADMVVTIPDANFRKALLADTNINTNYDDEIQVLEALETRTVYVFDKSISSLAGIEAFGNLTSLNCSFNELKELDLSKNTALKTVGCYGNLLTRLDFSNNKSLNVLNCRFNQLTYLNISSNLSLEQFYCSSNLLSSLDVSLNKNLSYLNCSSNQLVTLDISQNIVLISLECNENKLISLDVSKNKKMNYLDCSLNLLTSLYLSKGQSIVDLYYFGNPDLPRVTYLD